MLRIALFLSVLLASNVAGSAQSGETADILTDSIHDFPERLAEFPGGFEALAAYCRQFFPLPPTCHSRSWVIVKTTIDSRGTVREIRIVKNPGDAEVARKIIENIAKMPRWKPAWHDGKPVACRVTFPVRVCLEK